MAKLFVALLGVLAGFALAHLVNSTPEGKKALSRVRATFESFISVFAIASALNRGKAWKPPIFSIAG